MPLPEKLGTLQFAGFYDAGWIRLHTAPWANAISTATGRNDYWLQGAGVGFVYAYGRHVTLRGTWAHTLGANAGRSTTGQDADGRADHHRIRQQADAGRESGRSRSARGVTRDAVVRGRGAWTV